MEIFINKYLEGIILTSYGANHEQKKGVFVIGFFCNDEFVF